MCIISKHRWERLLPFEKMDLSIPEGSRFLVVTHSSELAHQGWHQSNRIPIGLELFLIFGLRYFHGRCGSFRLPLMHSQPFCIRSHFNRWMRGLFGHCRFWWCLPPFQNRCLSGGRLFRGLGKPLSDAELTKIIEENDVDHDGIDFAVASFGRVAVFFLFVF